MIEYDFKGNISLLKNNHNKVGIIGSRNVDSKTLNYAYIEGDKTARIPKVVVTGMANGVDTWAMVGALTEPIGSFAKNLQHIAVVPTIYCDGIPENNSLLINELLQKGGLLIAPKDPDIDYKQMYLRRNDLLVEIIDELITIGELGRGASYTLKKAIKEGVKISTE